MALAYEKIEPYKSMNVSMLNPKRGLPLVSITRLQRAEKDVQKKGYSGLPYYFVEQQQIEGRSISSIAIELGLPDRDLKYMRDDLNLPTLNKREIIRKENQTDSEQYSSENDGKRLANFYNGMFQLKSCPKCKGDLFIDHQPESDYANCMQCGFYRAINYS